jgi:hypothetical protein
MGFGSSLVLEVVVSLPVLYREGVRGVETALDQDSHFGVGITLARADSQQCKVASMIGGMI